MTDFVTRLAQRGMLHQCTDEQALRAHLASGVRTAYVGYDPTADSLTIGNLVTIMLLRHWQESGHAPLVLMGGGTGLIGDPSGKTAERELLTEEKVRANVESQKRIFSRLLDFSGPKAARMQNNADWLTKLGYIQVLRDVGKHFSVNQMVQRDSVKKRLEEREQGISYTEFSYMILQAYDFLHLHKHNGVTVQMGGSDQWGNIVSGCDLIRRDESAQATGAAETAAHIAAAAVAGVTDIATLSGMQMAADIARAEMARGVSFGVTTPLVTKADGGKFGKTESGAVWLTSERTSPYAYYQFWLNAADADAERFLKVFTLLPVEQIAATMAEQAANPGARAAQRLLAREATDLLHGKDEREKAEAAAAALFSGDVSALDERTLADALGAVPSTDHSKSLLDGQGMAAIDLLVEAKICKSKTEARQALTEGSVSANGKKLTLDSRLTTADLLHGKTIAVRRGKKNWFVTRWA
ncbi:MAG: tyrosine--tRNA ligase [Phycisphaerales bacterium]